MPTYSIGIKAADSGNSNKYPQEKDIKESEYVIRRKERSWIYDFWTVNKNQKRKSAREFAF
jgi:hypothetical protein